MEEYVFHWALRTDVMFSQSLITQHRMPALHVSMYFVKRLDDTSQNMSFQVDCG